MKKLFTLLFSLVLLVGCSTASSNPNKLSVSDIEWKAYYGIEDSRRYMLIDFTNNSKFTITDVYIQYTEKDNLSDSDKEVYYDDLSDKFNYTVEQLKEKGYDDILFSARNDGDIEAGSKATFHMYYYRGYYYIMSEEIFNLSKLDFMEIEYIDSEGNIQTTTYDFVNNIETCSADKN